MLSKYLGEKTWVRALEGEFSKPYFIALSNSIETEYDSGRAIYPPKERIFEALNLTPLDDVRAVILGQDPYHGPDQAHGLSFSVRSGVKLPPSLRNIFAELFASLKVDPPHAGDLTKWAEEGVLLLNSILTVEGEKPGSHQKRGWESFTDRIIEIVNQKKDPVAFVLWGKYAQDKAKTIDEKKHLVIRSAHPSPLSSYRGFFGSNPFSKVNSFLKSKGQKPIDWTL